MLQPAQNASPRLPDLQVRGMQGLGDNIFQRPFVHALSRQWNVYLETSWPEFYADLPINPVRPTTRLRTQLKNANRSRINWHQPPTPTHNRQVKTISYVAALRSNRSIISGMETTFGIRFEPTLFYLPPLPPSPLTIDKPIAFVRPATMRGEWYNESRNPKPEYIAAIVEELRSTHHIVTVADVEHPAEWFVGKPPKGDTEFIRGQLPAMQMLALLGASDIVVGGVGFIIPAAIALKKWCFVILGGMGGHNAPHIVADVRLDSSRLGFAMPRDFCQCTNMRHQCNKEIPDLMQQFSSFRARQASMTQLPSDACNGFPKSASAIIPPVDVPTISNTLTASPARPTVPSAAS